MSGVIEAVRCEVSSSSSSSSSSSFILSRENVTFESYEESLLRVPLTHIGASASEWTGFLLLCLNRVSFFNNSDFSLSLFLYRTT